MKQWVDGKGYANMSELAAEHTALPWGIKYETNVFDEKGRCVVPCGGHQSNFNSEAVRQENIANARFIVTACNNFEEMRETLKELHMGLKIRLTQEAASWGANAEKTTEFLSEHPTLNKLEALLSKLEGAK